MVPRAVWSAQITTKGTSAPLDTGSTVVLMLPRTAGGFKPQYVRISAAANPAYVRLGITASTATVTTGDSIVTSGEALWLNTLGMDAIAVRAISVPGIIQISPLEDGVIIPSPTATIG